MVRGYRLSVIVFVCFLFFVPSFAKKPQPQEVAPLSTEQEQQFTYYWYAAKQALYEERYADAYALLEFCHAIRPNDSRTLYFLGVIYSSLNQDEQAEEAFRQSFEANPRDEWYSYATVLLQKGTNDEDVQQYTEAAIAVMERALQAQQPKPTEELLELMLQVYTKTGDWKKTIATQDELDKIKGFDVYSAYYRYGAYMTGHQPKKAMAVLDRYLEIDPDYITFWIYKVRLMEYLGVKKKDLYAVYDHILELDPNNATMLNNYAYHLATHKGDLKKAERMSAITIRQEPDNAVYLDTYGWIMHLQGQNELALFYLEKALRNTDAAARAEIEQHLEKVKRK